MCACFFFLCTWALAYVCAYTYHMGNLEIDTESLLMTPYFILYFIFEVGDHSTSFKGRHLIG